jgi:hypothetical protein
LSTCFAAEVCPTSSTKTNRELAAVDVSAASSEIPFPAEVIITAARNEAAFKAADGDR